MPQGSLARRYARALMGIGMDSDTYSSIGSQLDIVARAMKTSDELTETLTNPAFPRSDRQKIFEAILDRIEASPVVRNFILLLLDRERVAALPDISRELNAMIDQHIGRVKAEVSSAAALTKAQLTQLKTILETISGKSVELENKEDPELLGGMVAKVGDVVYDGSLRTQLSQIRHSLTK
ncbi:MAG: ATP synthase F1 subunit delta [Proteobacteria bacterium]|nr:ATP synthase F1 subunit delta [Pseudomonadota bacterium]